MQKTTVTKFLMAAFAALFLSATFTACSEDDDDDEQDKTSQAGGFEDVVQNSSFATPACEADAAKYEIEDENCPYGSIEFTASGNYIVCYDDEEAASGASKLTQAKYHSYSYIAYGTYTKTGEGRYALKEFGMTVILTKDASGNAYDIQIERNGKTYRVRGSKANPYAAGSDNLTNMLCRTWKIAGYYHYMRYDEESVNVLFEEETIGDLYRKEKQWLIENGLATEEDFDSEDEEEMDGFENPAQEIVFTKTGTYMVFYKDSQLAVSTWRWKMQSKGWFRFSWDPDAWNDPEEEQNLGDCWVRFKNNKLYLGTYREEDPDDPNVDPDEEYALDEVGYILTE